MKQLINHLSIVIGVACFTTIGIQIFDGGVRSQTPNGYAELLAGLGVVFLAIAYFTRHSAKRWRFEDNATKAPKIVVACVIVAVLTVLLTPPVRAVREAARRKQCQLNLRAIGLAMQSYHAVYGSFPPAYIADERGRPIHNWRVLLLPIMSEQTLYKDYRLDEPWDGPHNASLGDRLKSSPFFCPSTGRQHETNYVAVIGPGTAMPGARPRKLDELRNGASNAILIVEVLNSGIHWMEPKDLNFDEMCFGINDPSGRGIASRHTNTPGSLWNGTVCLAHVLLADGTVREMPETTPPRAIHKLLLIDDEQTTPRP